MDPHFVKLGRRALDVPPQRISKTWNEENYRDKQKGFRLSIIELLTDNALRSINELILKKVCIKRLDVNREY